MWAIFSSIKSKSANFVLMSNQKLPLYKVILIGDSAVGKTNILSRINSNEFSNEFLSTVGVEFLTKIIQVGDAEVKAQIWDTAGQERFSAMMATYYRKSKVALLVYDISREETFRNTAKWYEQLKHHAESDVLTVLVGNKLDLQQQRKVSTQEGEELAETWDAMFFECSALTGENVHELFLAAMEKMHQIKVQTDSLSIAKVTQQQSFQLKDSSNNKKTSNNDCC